MRLYAGWRGMSRVCPCGASVRMSSETSPIALGRKSRTVCMAFKALVYIRCASKSPTVTASVMASMKNSEKEVQKVAQKNAANIHPAFQSKRPCV